MDASLTGSASSAIPAPGAAYVEGQFVAFRCGQTNYGIPIMTVREIRSWQPTTGIPGRLNSSRGVLDIRGTVVEVFDLNALLGGPETEPGAGSVVLVLALDDRVVGLLVDAVSDIIQTSTAEMMPVPANYGGSGWPARVTAMVQHEGGLIGILDLDRIFT